MTLPSRMTNDPVKIPADEILRIVHLAEKQLEPSEPTNDKPAQAVIPDGMKDALIILAPVARKETRGPARGK